MKLKVPKGSQVSITPVKQPYGEKLSLWFATAAYLAIFYLQVSGPLLWIVPMGVYVAARVLTTRRRFRPASYE